ncbi:unnamed protein product [Peniophora sp. CBMAI 1063]|nr:unnamed protein product [Peniophora sp. CBMAI 1063]
MQVQETRISRFYYSFRTLTFPRRLQQQPRMFPITCNAIGDIIAVVQLIRNIVIALDETRGAAEESKQFTRVLSALGTVMAEVYDLAKASHNETLRQAVLEEVRLCCIDINSAHKSISDFEKLEESSARFTRNTTRRNLKKIQWHLLRASDAAKYTQRFGESHQRLNSFICLLGHQSTSRLLNERCSSILAALRRHLRLAQDQSRAFRESSEEIKAVTLLALQEAAMPPRAQVMEQALSHPYFASSHARRIGARIRRVANMIYDSLAPNTPAAQRDRFLSLLAPFLVAGAAFVVHNNVDSQWKSTGLWSAICALVVHVLWLQSSTPMNPNFNPGDGIVLIGLLGEDIPVPSQFCSSYEYFHEFLSLFYSKVPGASDFVSFKRYELVEAGSSRLISGTNWASCTRPGLCMEMGLMYIWGVANDISYCPYCDYQYNPHSVLNEVVCASCLGTFRQTSADLALVKWAGVDAPDPTSTRRQGIEWHLALSQTDVQVTTLTTTAQHASPVDFDAAEAFARSCHRVHVINIHYSQDNTPEQMHLVSQLVVDALISTQDTFSRSTLAYELLRSHIQSPYHWHPKSPAYAHSLRAGRFIYDAALSELERSAVIGSAIHGSTAITKPMTVVHQLLARMVSALGAFIDDPSQETIRQWEDVLNAYSDKHLPLKEREDYQELVREHGRIGCSLRTAFGFTERLS